MAVVPPHPGNLRRDHVERLIPGDGDEILGAAALAATIGRIAEPAAAHRGAGDPRPVVNRVRHGPDHVRGVGIAFARNGLDQTAIADDGGEGTPMGGSRNTADIGHGGHGSRF
jgi:hypothetical protein